VPSVVLEILFFCLKRLEELIYLLAVFLRNLDVSVPPYKQSPVFSPLTQNGPFNFYSLEIVTPEALCAPLVSSAWRMVNTSQQGFHACDTVTDP